MKIDCPDEWEIRFQSFEKAEEILRANFKTVGVSRFTINQTFAAFGAVKSIWSDPAFRVWAALRDCVDSQDFLDRWGTLSRTSLFKTDPPTDADTNTDFGFVLPE